MSFIDFHTDKISLPSMIKTENDWAIFLDEKEDIIPYDNIGGIYKSLGQIENILAIIISIFSFSLITKLFTKKSNQDLQFSEIFWKSMIPLSALSLILYMVQNITFWFSHIEAVPNWFFPILFFTYLSALIYGFVINFKIIRYISNARFFKVLVIFLLSELISLGLLTIIFPFKKWFQSDEYVKSEEYLKKAEIQYNNKNFEKANSLLNEVINHRPNNLNANKLLLESSIKKLDVKILDIYFQYYYQKKSKLGDSIKIALTEYQTVTRLIDSFSNKFSFLPSAQVFAAEKYLHFNICEKAELNCSFVFNNNASSRDKIFAAAVLSKITTDTTQKLEYNNYLNNNVWLEHSTNSRYEEFGRFCRIYLSEGYTSIFLNIVAMITSGITIENASELYSPKNPEDEIIVINEINIPIKRNLFKCQYPMQYKNELENLQKSALLREPRVKGIYATKSQKLINKKNGKKK